MSSTDLDTQDLLELARYRIAVHHQLLLENISDLFLPESARLTDRERGLFADMLHKLVNDVDLTLRTKLREQLVNVQGVAPGLVEHLANDRTEITWPILLESRVLGDPDLIEIVKWRGQEHRLAVTMRERMGEPSGTTFVSPGDANVINTLIESPDAELSQWARAYLVEESQRTDRFQEPLLRIADLPSEIARRLQWWSAAAIRKDVVGRFEIDLETIDIPIESAADAAIAAFDRVSGSATKTLGEALQSRRMLTPEFIMRALREGSIALFIACLSRLLDTDSKTTRFLIFDSAGDGLAIAAKAADLDRQTLSTALSLVTAGHVNPRLRLGPDEIDTKLQLFDRLSVSKARDTLRYWRQDSAYITALRQIG